MSAFLDTLFFPPLIRCSPRAEDTIPWQRWGEGGGFQFVRSSFLNRDCLVLADNMELLSVLEDGCIDLVYIDPPFATGKHRKSPRGEEGPRGFDDTFESATDFVEWIAPRLREIWRSLTCDGNLVIHLDSRAVHYVKLWCDEEFGSERFENEIIWHYTGGGRSRSRFSRKHDVLLWYSKSPARTFNLDAVRQPYKPTSGYAKGGIVSSKGKKYLPHPEGTPVDDVWDIPIVNPLSSERTAYPTQKPLRLLERVIKALSNEGDIVMDVFSGSGTTAVACTILKRRFLCCDNNPDAIMVTLERLSKVENKASFPNVFSKGFYRLPYVTAEYAESSAKRFLEEALLLDRDTPHEMLTPLWSRYENPPYPLHANDGILSII